MITRRWWVIVDSEDRVIGQAPGNSPRRAVDAWLAGEGITIQRPGSLEGLWAREPSESSAAPALEVLTRDVNLEGDWA